MALVQKKFILVIIILLSIPSSYFFYRHFHPKYIPVPREETTLTIIPGWNLRQVADYLVSNGFATTTEQVYAVTGEPAKIYSKTADFNRSIKISREGKDFYLSLEGYLTPETFKVYKDSTVGEVIDKFFGFQRKEISDLWSQAGKSRRGLHEILTMASIVEKEVKFDADRAKVADILWRRADKGWPLQVDSSVHYAVDKTGDVFTTDKERAVDSPWNTYKNKGLPPGPICNPSAESINAALNPEKNDYWFFLSDKNGVIHYAKTLEEHNKNKRYL